MLDNVSHPTPFELAAAAVQDWLDGPGATIVTRVSRHDKSCKFGAWEMHLPHPVVGRQRVRLSLLNDFPASPPQVHFDKKLCLIWPHVEETGRFCHGVEPGPRDYADPTQVIQSVLKRVQAFWENTESSRWVSAEFQRESLSYWMRYCRVFQHSTGRRSVQNARVYYPGVDGVVEGKSASYFDGRGKNMRCRLLLASVGEQDPNVVAQQHGWSSGSLVRGHTLFVPLPDTTPWTPSEWPQTLAALGELVDGVTGNQNTLGAWLNEKVRQQQLSLLVVVVQRNVCYGFQIVAPLVQRLTPPQVTPIALERIDPDWALARDQQLPVLRERRQRRLLVLGCGSLGAPIAELLARAGIGELHLLDMENFEAPNCARHVLGAHEIGEGKADALSKRLRLSTPGLQVKGLSATAASYIASKCKPGDYDLVVDCTGESSVRTVLAHYRDASLGDCPVIHAWMEPFCSAAHAVFVARGSKWPIQDPSEKINVGQWPKDTRVQLPACGTGFHPYGAADAWQAAGFVVERILATLRDSTMPSTVWSWIRSNAFFDALGVGVVVNGLVPNSANPVDAIQISRTLLDVVGE